MNKAMTLEEANEHLESVGSNYRIEPWGTSHTLKKLEGKPWPWVERWHERAKKLPMCVFQWTHAPLEDVVEICKIFDSLACASFGREYFFTLIEERKNASLRESQKRVSQKNANLAKSNIESLERINPRRQESRTHLDDVLLLAIFEKLEEIDARLERIEQRGVPAESPAQDAPEFIEFDWKSLRTA